MQIKKGLVKYKERNDILCTYGVTDDGKTYYFLEGNVIPNGNIIATTILVEAIDPLAKASSIGVIDKDGNIIIPFENKSIKTVNNDLLVVEKSVPVTESVIEANELRGEPQAASKLVTTPAIIKDNLYAKMGSEGKFVFNDQFSEATVYDINGNNIVENQLYSFIGMSNDKIYLCKNTSDSKIDEYNMTDKKFIPYKIEEEKGFENSPIPLDEINKINLGDDKEEQKVLIPSLDKNLEPEDDYNSSLVEDKQDIVNDEERYEAKNNEVQSETVNDDVKDNLINNKEELDEKDNEFKELSTNNEDKSDSLNEEKNNTINIPEESIIEPSNNDDITEKKMPLDEINDYSKTKNDKNDNSLIIEDQKQMDSVENIFSKEDNYNENFDNNRLTKMNSDITREDVFESISGKNNNDEYSDIQSTTEEKLFNDDFSKDIFEDSKLKVDSIFSEKPVNERRFDGLGVSNNGLVQELVSTVPELVRKSQLQSDHINDLNSRIEKSTDLISQLKEYIIEQKRTISELKSIATKYKNSAYKLNDELKEKEMIIEDLKSKVVNQQELEKVVLEVKKAIGGSNDFDIENDSNYYKKVA